MYDGVLFLLGKNAARLFRNEFVKTYEAKPVDIAIDSETYLVEKYGRRVAVKALRPGVPNARETIPNFIRDGRKFIAFGYAHGDDCLAVGDIVLPYFAILSERHMKYLYDAGENPEHCAMISNSRLCTLMSGIIKREEAYPKTGNILTRVPDDALDLFDGHHRLMDIPETSRGNLREFRPLCCDMETAYIMLKAKESGKPAVSVVVISDNARTLATYARDPVIHWQKIMALPNNVRTSSRAAIIAALDVMLIEK